MHELRGRELFRVRAQAMRVKTRGVERSQHCCERFGFRRVEEYSGFAFDDGFERAAASVGDRRTSGRRRLERNEPEVFFAGKNRGARVAQQFVEPRDPGRNRAASCVVPRASFFNDVCGRPRAGDYQLDAGLARGADRELDALVGQ